jgi:fused signal recognition particle receptor
MGIFAKIKAGLKKTTSQVVGKIDTLIGSFTKIDEDFFDQLEEILILADIGINTSLKICEQLRERVKKNRETNPEAIKQLLKEIITEILGENKPLNITTTPSVLLVIGVNGVGKTTTIGKLAYNLKSSSKKIILGAGDTFRAAAIEQLNIWAERAGVDIIKHTQGSDPAAVVFDTIKAANSRGANVAICDTAGRLHNKKNLMNELNKINRVIERETENCDVEILLVLDATTGQNAISQAKEFKSVCNVTGIILTKLDGTAKGGIVIAIKNELDIPIKYIGVGEGIDDLQEFDPNDFVNALFEVQ